MKKFTILVLSLLTLSSCQDFLLEEPRSQISTNQFFRSPEDARSVVNSLYHSGVSGFYDNLGGLRGNGIMMGGYMSGLFDSQNKGEAQSIIAAQRLTLNPVNLSQFLGDLWARAYQAISRANTAIKYIPAVEGFPEDESSRLLAEAKFFRAFNYFYLVKNFGDVPLITEPYESLEDMMVSRSDAETVYSHIVADLTWVLDQGGLADVPFPINGFRVTKGAAGALLADVYLQMSGYPVLKDDSYARAAEVARTIVSDGKHELIPNGAIMEESAYNVMRTSDMETEYMYAIEYNTDFLANSVPQFAYPGNIRPTGIKYGRTSIGYFPIAEYIQVYDSDKDLRVQNQQLFFNEITINGNHYEFNEWAPYLFHDDRALFETGRGDMDIRVYRYAEILLIAAEAIAQVEGVTSEAVSYLVDVRSRAYWQTERSQLVTSLSQLSKAEFIEEVWKERLRELALDYKTWSDIQRTRKYPLTSELNLGEVNFVDVIGQSNNWGETFNEFHLLYPIPDDEIQRNPELVQNPGY